MTRKKMLLSHLLKKACKSAVPKPVFCAAEGRITRSNATDRPPPHEWGQDQKKRDPLRSEEDKLHFSLRCNAWEEYRTIRGHHDDGI